MGKTSDSYSIRQVIELTGLSEFTLRGWENRYKAFKPRRGSTGRRSYSHNDLEKAILLRELLLRDHRIGNIAELSTRDLEALLEKNVEQITQPPGKFQSDIEKILRHLSLQSWDEMEADLNRVTRAVKPNIALRDIVVPLVKELGRLVANGVISIAQEHIFSAILKERLYTMRDQAPKSSGKIRFIVASPEGDYHELGILIAHTMMACAGIKTLYLGPNSPKTALCETAMRFGATHLLLGSTVSRKEGAKEDLYSYLNFIDRHLNRGTEIWLGGRNAVSLPSESERTMLCFGSLTEFERAISSVGKK